MNSGRVAKPAPTSGDLPGLQPVVTIGAGLAIGRAPDNNPAGSRPSPMLLFPLNRIRYLLGSLLVAVLLPGSAVGAPSEVPAPIKSIGGRIRFPTDSLSVYVIEIGAREPVLAFNADVPRNPASAIKIVTTWAALEELGPTYTWRTEAWLGGPMRGDILDGDLILKGKGDPYLVTEEVWRMLGALRRRGLREITGDLVIDSSYFDLPPESPGGFDNQPYRAYNVLAHPLLFNYRTVRFDVFPGSGQRARIEADPLPANLEIANKVQIVDGACRGDANAVTFGVSDPPAAAQVVIGGRLARGCPGAGFVRAVLTPETFALGLFQTVWQQLGGTFTGTVRNGSAPARGRPWFVWESRTLAEAIRGLNKFSNNTMARHFLLTLGAEKHQPPATLDKGARAVTELMKKRGIDAWGLEIANGSGLARETRVTARTLAEVLVDAWRSPRMPEFVASLPIAGVDGTMRRRFRGRPEAGHMHIKTGSLREVSAIAGYVHGADGRTFAVVSLMNDRQAQWGLGSAVHDEILRWTWRQSQPPPAPRKQ